MIAKEDCQRTLLRKVNQKLNDVARAVTPIDEIAEANNPIMVGRVPLQINKYGLDNFVQLSNLTMNIANHIKAFAANGMMGPMPQLLVPLCRIAIADHMDGPSLYIAQMAEKFINHGFERRT